MASSPSTSSTSPTSTSISTSVLVPTLGLTTPAKCQGCGTVQPSLVKILGYSRAGVVFQEVDFNDVKWQSWGGSQVRGAAQAFYSGPGEYAAVTLLAFDLGYCNGAYVYQRLQWFPSGAPKSYFNVCTGQGVGPGWP